MKCFLVYVPWYLVVTKTWLKNIYQIFLESYIAIEMQCLSQKKGFIKIMFETYL